MSDITIPLTRGMVSVIDEVDSCYVEQYRWYAHMSDSAFYARALITGKLIYMHRLLMSPACDGLYVDHINGNTLDNRRANLRVVSARQNAMNMRSPRLKAGDMKGVLFHKDPSRTKQR